jgi:hypothetical protein
MDEVFSSQLDLTDQPISHLDVEYFTDGSSFVWDGMRFAGYATATLNSELFLCPLAKWDPRCTPEHLEGKLSTGWMVEVCRWSHCHL